VKIVLASDHRGADMLKPLTRLLENEGVDAVVLAAPPAGGSCDYTDTAYPVARVVADGEADLGILICGTGLGMSIAANKVAGVRAALVHDEITAEMSRRHNDANVLCLGADLLGERLIQMIVSKWIRTEFEGGRHARRLAKLHAIEAGEDPRSVSGPVEAPRNGRAASPISSAAPTNSRHASDAERNGVASDASNAVPRRGV